MFSIIVSSAGTQHIALKHAAPQQVKVSAKDSDGDNDGSKAVAVEKPKATTGNIGTLVNTSA